MLKRALTVTAAVAVLGLFGCDGGTVFSPETVRSCNANGWNSGICQVRKCTDYHRQHPWPAPPCPFQ